MSQWSGDCMVMLLAEGGKGGQCGGTQGSPAQQPTGTPPEQLGEEETWKNYLEG